ncbi:hypothetical protein [Paludisphaera rhizosphaerae]|uniref:hypothetical protein n=1 Tax=Paludisphaera rhizosphaerae TaxID=2711216 RepID=UPI0013ED498C|nr:hypothetical protein [Paludisphaera rhizosphaerae]
MGWTRGVRLAMGLSVCLTAAGCSEELGPESIPTTTASGVVTFSNRPMTQGWVELQPYDGALGDPTSARIGPDGSFRFDRAPVGKVVVRLFDVPLEAKGAIWLLRTRSPIRRETQSPEGPPMRIDIADELYRHQLSQAGAGR